MTQCSRLYQHGPHTFNEVGVVETQTGNCPGLGRAAALVAHAKWLLDWAVRGR